MKRNTKRSLELYKSLSLKQRAALSLECAPARNADEMKAIYNSVPEYHYRLPDIEFRAWCDVFFHVAAIAGLEWWKSYAVMLAFDGFLLERHLTGDEDATEQARLETHWDTARKQQAAIYGALKQFCAKHGLSLEAACEIASIPVSGDVGAGAVPMTEAVETKLAEYESIMPEWMQSMRNDCDTAKLVAE